MSHEFITRPANTRIAFISNDIDLDTEKQLYVIRKKTFTKYLSNLHDIADTLSERDVRKENAQA